MAVWSTPKLSALAGGLRIDPEYYQPRYLQDAKHLGAIRCVAIGNMAFVTDGIHGSPEEVEEGGIRYLSAKCVKDNDFSLGDTLWISPAQHDANIRTQLHVDDVLITTVGTIGNAAVVQPDFLPANSDRHLGIIRLENDAPVDPYYLAAFLNSEYGRFQSLREATGNVQLNLFIEKIKGLQIPVLNCAGEVSKLTRAAYAARVDAMEYVKEAEELMVSALGLSNADFMPSKTYSRKIGEMLAENRFGAEYFMPCKRRIIEFLKSQANTPLMLYVENVRDLWNPEEAGEEEVVRNFDLSHALEPFLDDRQEVMRAQEVGSTKKRFREGDVVISRLRSYLKEIAIVRCSGTVPCVGSSEFIVLRSFGQLAPETLLALLRSEVVQTVLRWSQDGTNHPRFDERELSRLPVPNAVLRIQPELKDLVGTAIKSRQKVLRLLRQAKKAIEDEIGAG